MSTVPLWGQILIGAAAVVVAAGVVWRQALKPGAMFISETQKMIPVVRDLTEKLVDPTVVSVLVDIAKQFKADSGTTLRDVVNRLEAAADANKAAIEALVAQNARAAQSVTTGQEASRLLAQEDRVLLADLRSELRRMHVKADDAAEAAAQVADDLEASHMRAEMIDGDPGQAADAAAQRPPAE